MTVAASGSHHPAICKRIDSPHPPCNHLTSSPPPRPRQKSFACPLVKTTASYDAYMADGKAAFATVDGFFLVEPTAAVLMAIPMLLHIPKGEVRS